MKLGNHLDFRYNEARQMVLQKLTADPDPAIALIYFNVNTKAVRIYHSNAWHTFSQRRVIATAPLDAAETDDTVTLTIRPATQSERGTMSEIDKAKLDNSTDANTANAIVKRDANGDFTTRNITANKITGLATPSSGSDAVNKAYVDGLIDKTLKPALGYAPNGSNTYPTTYDGRGVQQGDTFRMANAGTVGTQLVNTDDLLIANVDDPAQVDVNWQIIESNRDQATETVKGVLQIATDAKMNAETDDATAVTPKKLKTRLVADGYARKRAFALVGDASTLAFVLTHNLNTLDVAVYVREDTGVRGEVFVDKEHTTVNTVTVRFAAAPAVNENYSAVVIG